MEMRMSGSDVRVGFSNHLVFLTKLLFYKTKENNPNNVNKKDTTSRIIQSAITY